MSPWIKRRKLQESLDCSSPNWSDMHIDFLGCVVDRLSSSFLDVLRFKAVCSNWKSVAKTHLSSSLFTPDLKIPPWLLLPDEDSAKGSCSFFSLAEKKTLIYLKKPRLEKQSRLCIGSSHGWLIFWEQKDLPFSAFNPLTESRLDFPSHHETCFPKAILSSDPKQSKTKSCFLFIIHGFLESEIAYCRSEDTAWSEINGSHKPYSDIIFRDEKLHALSDEGSVEIWAFSKDEIPVKLIDIQPSFSEKLYDWEMRDKMTTRWYLVESSKGDLLVVVRYIGEFVDGDGQLLTEADLLTDDQIQPLICPYKTVGFGVYKLEFGWKKWVKVESLGDGVVFVGMSESMWVSASEFRECKRNCIYFTDDYSMRMDEDENYGGHDMGVFSLDDNTITLHYQSSLQKFEPPPIWVIPNPW
ncbi:Domain unknown function DUF295 [Dillenia turbinata]|uniref:KIB1-4 beta-propeller domain-containing protein n=1 Tax=Dillenia turbinata TaxID=194707 RepID=A0AAN8UEY8_9MAGN